MMMWGISECLLAKAGGTIYCTLRKVWEYTYSNERENLNEYNEREKND